MKVARLLLTGVVAHAGSKADPAGWILWRAAPITFPDSITPRVPELMQSEQAMDFQSDGSDLTIIMPDHLGDDYDRARPWIGRGASLWTR